MLNRRGPTTTTMNAALRKQLRALQRLFADANTNEIRTRYRIASIVASVQRAPRSYGARAVESLALALGCDRATLYRYAQIVSRFERKAVDAIVRSSLAHPRANLSWSHLMVLATIDDAKLRAQLLHAVFEGISVRELERRAVGDEPKSATPDASVVALRRLLSVTESLKGRASIDIDASNPSHELVDLIASIMASQDELREMCERNVRRLRTLRVEMEQTLQGTPRRIGTTRSSLSSG